MDAELDTGQVMLRLQEVTTNAYFVFTTGVFDYEETARASLEIICVDNANDAKTSLARFQPKETLIRVTVSIGDANDHYPEFGISEYVTKIPEHCSKGTVVADLKATDADSGINARITYSLTKLNEISLRCDVLDVLHINPQTGTITVHNGDCLDRELFDELTVFVAAEDGGGLSTSIKLRITLTDINDHAPVFEGPNQFTIRENFPESFTIGQIKCSDADIGMNSVIHIQLSENNSRQVLDSFDLIPDKDPRKLLQLTSKQKQVSGKREVSALLISRASFDRELTESFVIEIVATDSGSPALRSTKSIYVNILDENDNRPIPRFPQPGTTIGSHPKVYVNSPFDTEVCKLRSSDPDKGENGSVIYDFQSNSNGSQFFRIDRLSGRMSTAWHYYRNGRTGAPKSGIYTIKVNIFDAGAPAIKVLWEFFVHISPKNPSFTSNLPSPLHQTIDHEMGRNFTSNAKLSQMTNVMIVFAVFIILALFISCVCMIKFLCRTKLKPELISPGVKDRQPSAYSPTALGIVYSRPQATNILNSTTTEIPVLTPSSIKYQFATSESENWCLPALDMNRQLCDQQMCAEAQTHVPNPLLNDFYYRMQYGSECNTMRSGTYSPSIWPQFAQQ